MCNLRNILLVGLISCTGMTAMGRMARVKSFSDLPAVFSDSPVVVNKALMTTGMEFKFITSNTPIIGSIVDGVTSPSLVRPTAEVVARADQQGLKIVTLTNVEEKRYRIFFKNRTEETRHLVFKKGYTPEEQIEEALAAMGDELYGHGKKIAYIESTYPFGFKQPDWDGRHVLASIANYVETSENYQILVPSWHVDYRSGLPFVKREDIPLEDLIVSVTGTLNKNWK